MRFQPFRPSSRYAEEARRCKHEEQKMLDDPRVFTVGADAHQWAAMWVDEELTTIPLHADSYLPWRAALGMNAPDQPWFELVINAVLRRAVSDGVIAVPEPGAIRSKGNIRDPLTEDTIGITLGFEALRTKRLIAASPESLMYADLNARPELGAHAVVALLHAVSDIMRAPRYL
ncbi:hypothetical protein [Nocardia sp. NPDC058705]|uniref:hypothetical protein n=1 Tax=Nocardia sp. NPDC058705 TaxID=3346609 RepID=UPI0036811968